MSNTVNNYTETDLGNISLNPRGEYDSSVEYEYLDAVSYQGGSYFCLAELETTITGIAPDAGRNSEHWQMIAAPGDMTPEYTAAYNNVINKAVQVEESRAAVELAQQEIEAVQTDVQQLHSDTVQTAQEAENSKNSAADSAQSAEQSRKTASESERNINGQIAGFDSRVFEAVEQSKEEINTTKQQAINTITNQQDASVNIVKTEGEKIITKVGNDAKTVADDRATVEEATQTVLNNAQEVARNAQTVASNTEKAAASAESAKTSADNAAQSAKSVEDASKQIEQNKKDVASLKEDLSNKITKFYASNQGETHITDSDNGKIQDMMIYGKSSQDGTPTPENPVEIKSVVNPTVKVTNEDGLKVQSVTLNNITLNAIPVSSGGNVTIGEQQYISDYVDIEKGKLYRKVKRLNLKDANDISIAHGFHSNGNGYLSFDIVKNANKEQQPISNRYKGSMWTSENGCTYIPNNNAIVFVDDRFTDRQTAIKLVQDTYVIYALSSQTEEDLSLEQIKSLKSLSTYYPTTNISVNSEQLDGYTVFNYPTPFEDEWNKTQKEIGSLKEDFGRVSPSAEYIGKNLVIPSVKDILVDKTTHYGKTLDTTKAGNSEEVYTDNVERNCSALNAIESNTAYTIFSVGHNQRLQLFWRIAFYDSNYAHIKDIYDVVSFTSPDNAAYFIVDTYSTDSSIKSEALESFSMIYVVNGTYDFEQIRSIFPLHNNKLENTRATTGYEGKTWMCIGDSITEHNFRAMFNYHDYASKELGINIINCGISGSGYIIHDSDEESATIPPFYKRIEEYANAGYKPDLITIFGGINDLMFTDAPVGENTDMTVDTLLGGVNLAIAKIKQYFPNVPFAIISPLPAYACQDGGTCYADYSPSSKTNKEYLFIAALADYCDYHGIPFLNQYNQTGFRPWDENFRTEYTKYSPSAPPDGLHPNAKGHALIYPKIREFIKTLI